MYSPLNPAETLEGCLPQLVVQLPARCRDAVPSFSWRWRHFISLFISQLRGPQRAHTDNTVRFKWIIVIMLSVMISFILPRCLIPVFIAVIFQLLLCTFQTAGILGGSCETCNNKSPLFISHCIVLSLLRVLSRFCMDGTLWRQSNTFSHC